ncbi:type IV toxin-antitoxin system AbiEi family antitoxin domain-containing protein [Homoserinibacter sp. YIM 151385]|uniref:type IV toxin-antitoxin system AbiEi family antitoxin domain-containing protein n=1 Tax=Homoserinibacter sp. YIM 151385 TaxID=2985506 RepID=UPI0022F04149|nr:type IV toxin-antitoxin system AbiEi family antitoxin domain-containing protein [Homoserinibacter sp. YIM 151385]WBU39178.1 type IV toxin-antitoxin system AbiEi family antitoxin domain-containing protein [Homoserinibacter sp. YIM 151385]
MDQILTYRELRQRGLSRRAIERMIEDGRLRRVRTGHYATAVAEPDVTRAVRVGGSVTCAAALRRHGVWVLERTSHVRVDRDARRRSEAGGPPVHRLAGISFQGVDDVETAMRAACRCLSLESLVAAADSALELGLIDQAGLEAAMSGSARGRDALARTDARAESGLESIVRVRLRSLGIRVEPQVRIDGIGRVDLLIGNRLVIELDGDRWHSTAEQRESDRRRDVALQRRGYIVLRFGYHRVIEQWDDALADILAFVRRGAHRGAVHGDR